MDNDFRIIVGAKNEAAARLIYAMHVGMAHYLPEDSRAVKDITFETWEKSKEYPMCVKTSWGSKIQLPEVTVYDYFCGAFVDILKYMMEMYEVHTVGKYVGFKEQPLPEFGDARFGHISLWGWRKAIRVNISSKLHCFYYGGRLYEVVADPALNFDQYLSNSPPYVPSNEQLFELLGTLTPQSSTLDVSQKIGDVHIYSEEQMLNLEKIYGWMGDFEPNLADSKEMGEFCNNLERRIAIDIGREMRRPPNRHDARNALHQLTDRSIQSFLAWLKYDLFVTGELDRSKLQLRNQLNKFAIYSPTVARIDWSDPEKIRAVPVYILDVYNPYGAWSTAWNGLSDSTYTSIDAPITSIDQSDFPG